jgi:hypothetical protein
MTQTAMELKSFNFSFQISKLIVFEVDYYKLGDNQVKYFSTSAAQFNQPKTDFNHCGQAQKQLLKGAKEAMSFFNDFDQYHLKDLTPAQHDEILNRIGELKAKYNYIETDKYATFSELRALTRQIPKHLAKK